MMATTYATWHAVKAASARIYLPMLRAGGFAFFAMMIDLSAKTIASQ